MNGSAVAPAAARLDLAALLDVPGAGKRTVRFRRKEYAYQQGDAANALYLIRKGRIKLSVTSPFGKEATVALLGEGDIFGARLLIGRKRREHNACAMVDCECLEVRGDVAIRLLRSDPRLSEAFLHYVMRRTARLEEYLLYQLFENSERRLARVLLELSNFGDEEENRKVIRDVTHEVLAQMVGTTRPRISSFIARFRRLGYIKIEHGIHVQPSLVKVLMRKGEDSAE